MSKLDNDKIEQIKKTIKKLQKITIENNASENEVLIATKTIQNLLIKYHIELNDIKDFENKKKAITREIFRSGRFLWYDEMLASILRKYYFVSIFKQREDNTTILKCVGYPEDIDFFEGIYKSLRNIMKSSFKYHYDKNKELNRNDFYKGFIIGLNDILDKNTKENEAQFSTALVLVNTAIKEEISKVKLRKSNKSGVKPKFQNNIHSYSEGYQEGKNVGKDIGKNDKIENKYS